MAESLPRGLEAEKTLRASFGPRRIKGTSCPARFRLAKKCAPQGLVSSRPEIAGPTCERKINGNIELLAGLGRGGLKAALSNDISRSDGGEREARGPQRASKDPHSGTVHTWWGANHQPGGYSWQKRAALVGCYICPSQPLDGRPPFARNNPMVCGLGLMERRRDLATRTKRTRTAI